MTERQIVEQKLSGPQSDGLVSGRSGIIACYSSSAIKWHARAREVHMPNSMRSDRIFRTSSGATKLKEQFRRHVEARAELAYVLFV